MLRPELKYGLIAGLIISLWYYAEYFLGFHTVRSDIGRITAQLHGLVLIFTLWVVLRQQQIAFGPAFRLPGALRCGLFLSLVAATIIYISTILYRVLINPDWLVNELGWRIAEMRASGLDETQIQKNAEQYRQYYTSGYFLLNTLYRWTIQGALYSIFLTFWLKWQNREKAK